ncbi:MAG: glycosyltransferase family 1 protein [Parcubacteria group bacterium]|jgi:glycosyltransferase involved in cell wall biosynthesis
MKIGFDARCLEEEKISGVGEYALELLKNLLETDKKNEYIVFSNSFKQKTNRNFEWIKKYPHAKLKRFSFPNRILNFCFWYLNWPKIDKLVGGADIFFAPNINFLSVSSECRLVATFHDLSFERYPHFFLFKTRLWHEYFVAPRKIARIAEKIIAVSESTKKDLETIYKTDPEKINAVHHGISRSFKVIDRNDPKLLDIQRKYSLPYKFVLYLGNIEPRKNISSIVAAYKKTVSENPILEGCTLVLAGNISPLCREMVEKENLKTCGYIEREDRPYVYNLASLFVYPSFFEGFGLPVLEAMACGTPVIASNNSSIPEVAGEAAIFIDPNRPSELYEAIEALLTNEKLYAKIKERGLAQSQKLSWKKCALESMPAFSGR